MCTHIRRASYCVQLSHIIYVDYRANLAVPFTFSLRCQTTVYVFLEYAVDIWFIHFMTFRVHYLEIFPICYKTQTDAQ